MDPAYVPAKFEVHSFTHSWDNSGYLKTLGSRWIRRSRSSDVVDFGTKRKRVCDFLLVRHSNLAPILHRLGDNKVIAGFLCSWVTPALFHPNFGSVPVAPDRPCWGQPAHRPKAIRQWNYFRRIPTYVITIPKRCRQTDGQADGRHTCTVA